MYRGLNFLVDLRNIITLKQASAQQYPAHICQNGKRNVKIKVFYIDIADHEGNKHIIILSTLTKARV